MLHIVRTAFTLLLLAVGQLTLAQAPLKFTFRTYDLADDSTNFIQNADYLEPFFEALVQLKTTGRGKINIIHLGDSHIQADFLTDVVRRNFQRDFGNAGRGLIVPGRVAGTNEPNNFRTSVTTPWKSKRAIYPEQPMPIGIGGITISTDETETRLSIKVDNTLNDYSFNSVSLFFQKDPSSYSFSVKDTQGQELGISGPYEVGTTHFSRIEFQNCVDQVFIQPVKSNDDQRQATLYGISLENGNDGVLYHAIGVNGAKYKHYNAAKYFVKQTPALAPNLFIISLGTNESADYPYLDPTFTYHLEKLVQSLKEENPQAKFILVTPPEAFRKKVKPNPAIEKIRQQIIQYAVENGFAFWDMYKVVGGKQAATAWRAQGLLRPDGIHFTKEGYEYQGNLIYEAFIKTYNRYVGLRHP
ncbi:GDSL-type esterase/lipase family protein [Chryseolinea lacunae]|uniref:SGNH hydrolase-type esterase domain-containing protein n=1 Tax=Chryseolinea lacunae TaxID=2801331 RepID=A0ABS1KTV6_9BACT|nr:hypothetical protein [Chryseolinea lacunae]